MKRYTNKELMLAAGSKNGAHDPEAPDQWKWVMLRAKDPHERAMAWVKSLTTAFKHESPFCIDEHGKPVYAERLAADMGWKPQTAINVLSKLEAQGRIRLEKGKRIWYCADIPQSHESDENPDTDPTPPLTPEEEARRKKSERFYSVQSCWGTYVSDFIEKVPTEEKQNEMLSKLETCKEWKREFLAGTMAAARIITDRVEDSTLLEIGVPKKRLPKRPKPDAETKTKWVQVKLFAEPDFVQSCDLSLYKVENDFVDARAFRTAATAAKPLEADAHSAPPSPPAEPGKKQQEVGRSVGVGFGSSEPEPTYLPTAPSVDLIPDPRSNPHFRGLVEAVEAVAVPVIGESPSDAQYMEIHRRLDGASPQHYRERLEAKKAAGKLNSVMVLVYLADDCAKAKSAWKPPPAKSSGKKSFVESVTQEAARRLEKWGRL